MKVHLSCRSHPRYGHVFEDLEARAIVWGLWLLAVQYHAAQTDDEVTLGHGDLAWLTGRERYGNGLARLRRHAGAMGYVVRCEGRRVVVGVRNLKQKQGFDSALRGGATHTSAPSEVPKNRRTKEPTTRAPRSPKMNLAEAEERVGTLIDGVLAAQPGQSVPEPGSKRWENWCRHMDLLHRLGPPGGPNHPWPWSEIDRTLGWVSQDDFWRDVVRSAEGFRRNFATIQAKMKPAGGNSAGYRPPREFEPESEAIQKRIAALESLKAEDDRAYSAAEVEKRMEERDGSRTAATHTQTRSREQ